MQRLRWLLERLLGLAGIWLGGALLCFLALELAPGDALTLRALEPGVGTAELEAERRRLGLDRPWPERYGRWLLGTLRGDLGSSWTYRQPVAELLGQRLGPTLGLALLGLALGWGLALPLAVASAAGPGRVLERPANAFTTLLQAIPEPLLALGLLALATSCGRSRTTGLADGDLLQHAAWPAAAMALAAVPAVFRHAHAALATALAAPCLLAARARGVPQSRLLWSHALPMSARPLLGLLGLSLASLLSASLVVETIWGWPGLGPLLLEAVLARDVPLVVGAVLLAGTLALVATTLVDLLVGWIDPRARPA